MDAGSKNPVGGLGVQVASFAKKAFSRMSSAARRSSPTRSASPSKLDSRGSIDIHSALPRASSATVLVVPGLVADHRAESSGTVALTAKGQKTEVENLEDRLIAEKLALVKSESARMKAEFAEHSRRMDESQDHYANHAHALIRCDPKTEPVQFAQAWAGAFNAFRQHVKMCADLGYDVDSSGLDAIKLPGFLDDLSVDQLNSLASAFDEVGCPEGKNWVASRAEGNFDAEVLVLERLSAADSPKLFARFLKMAVSSYGHLLSLAESTKTPLSEGAVKISNRFDKVGASLKELTPSQLEALAAACGELQFRAGARVSFGVLVAKQAAHVRDEVIRKFNEVCLSLEVKPSKSSSRLPSPQVQMQHFGELARLFSELEGICKDEDLPFAELRERLRTTVWRKSQGLFVNPLHDKVGTFKYDQCSAQELSILVTNLRTLGLPLAANEVSKQIVRKRDEDGLAADSLLVSPPEVAPEI